MKQNHHNNQPNDKPGNQPKQSFYVTTSIAYANAKPWEIAKTNPANAVEFLSAMAGELTQVANALAPFLPETSQKISAVFDDGKIAPSPQVLFPRID